MKAVRVVVSGKVQGVFYRDSTRQVARDLGITGTVRNLPDGRVMIEAEGEDAQLQKLVTWCHQGPRDAHVTDVHVEEVAIKGFADFVILR